MSLAGDNSCAELLAQLRAVVGKAHVLVDHQATRRFRKGHRTGLGNVLAVVRPGTLVEQWPVLSGGRSRSHCHHAGGQYWTDQRLNA